MVLEKSPFPEDFLGVDLFYDRLNLFPFPLWDAGSAFVGLGGDAWPEDHPGTGGPLGLGWQRVTSNTTATLGTGTFGNVQAWGVPVKQGKTYTASCYTFSNHTDTRGITIYWMDETGGGAAIATTIVTITNAPINTWQRHHITMTPPPGAGYARVVGRVSPNGAWGAGWVLGFANPLMELGEVLNDWHAAAVPDWQPLGDDLDQSGVRVQHGARSEGGTADVSSLGFRVTNSDGMYSPRNPTSPLNGLVGRNTPARARADLGAPWLDLEAAGARATTPHAVALAITGDIDIRWWGSRDAWNFAADLVSKWSTTSNQRSHLLRAEASGGLTLFWSPDGTAVLEARSLVAMPPWPGEIALRATLDVDNGAGGRTARFYYGPTGLNGPWTQLGPDVVATGTTSIFNATAAALTVGREPTSAATDTPQRVHGWQVRNGIAGTIVSGRTVSDLTVGATAFTDSQGNAWTVTGGSVSNTHVLAVCEVAEWPVDWNTKGAPSVMTEVQASGVTRRLGQGAQAVDSVLYRTLSGIEGLVGYWPMEDGSDATELGAAVGDRSAAIGSEVDPAAYDAFPGSAPIPTLGSSRIRAELDKHTSTGDVQVRWVQWTPAAGVPAEVILARVEFVGGTVGRAELKMNNVGALGMFGYDHDGNEMAGSQYVAFAIENTYQRLSLELEQNGSDLDWQITRLAPGDAIGSSFQGSFTNPHTLGRMVRVVFNAGYDDMGDVAMGHLTVETVITSIYDVSGGALVGYTGELAINRMLRLARESGVSLTSHGRGSAALGEQQEETLLDLLAESADADGGILYDDPRAIALRYRVLRAMGDQPAVTIPYTDNLVIPFTPTDDDGLTRNRVTVSRPNGTRITHERTDGPLSILPPSQGGVGLYDTTLTRNLHTDDFVDRTASWLLHVGTWDESRYPSLGVDLAHPALLADPVLTRQLLDLMPGDRLVITDPPPWLPPRSVDVLVMGVQIEITPLNFRLRWTCVPARPYHVGYWNAGHRYSAEGTVLTSGVTATATTLPLTVPSPIVWTHVDGDYDITVGGEVMTVTNVVGTTMTVTRSVNGVVKAHSAGAPVALANPSFYSR